MIEYNRAGLPDQQLLELYAGLLKPRMIEEKMLILLRQGRVSKWFSGIGQEAIAVAVAAALQPDEWIMPLHRNLGVFTGRGLPLAKLMAQWQGKRSGYSKGRERSFHFGTAEHHIAGMISHLGPQLALADGVGLAHQLRGEQKIALAFTGEGATSEGDFHEALNVAAVWNLPVIFMIENNGYGLSTPTREQFVCQHLVDKAIGYGMKGIQADGNNILEMYQTIRQARQEILAGGGPVLIEALTFRMRGHEEASGTAYVPKELFEMWEKKDPVRNYEAFLMQEGVLTQAYKEELVGQIKKEIEQAIEVAFAEPEPAAPAEEELADVYAPFVQQVHQPEGPATEKRYIDAISEGLRQSMERFPQLVLMGQDIAEYGGAFKITKDFVGQFGKERVRNTPLCESAIVGTALGLSLEGFKAMVEMQFADFVTCGFNQIINNLAKIHYRWGQQADVVIRMPTGAGVGAGPFHSQSNEAWFFHTPGLKVVFPSNPYDAKGLLNAALEDPNPYLFFEHKALYRAISAPVPDAYYTVEVGRAAVVQSGTDVTVVTYGMGVHWAVEAAKNMPETSVEIIDLRTLLPWDQETVAHSVRKTGKVLVCHEDCLTGGIGAEISAWIAEHCFEWLDAPVMREGSLDTPVPFAISLEKGFLPAARIAEKLGKLAAY